MEPTLRPMRASDMIKQSKYILPKFYGVVAELDGEEIGSCSVVWGDKGRAYLSLESTDKLKQKPVFMIKVVRSLIEGATKSGDLYTIEDKDEPTSRRLLEFLGFRPTGEDINGERILSWQR